MVSGLTDAVLEKLMTEESCRGEALSRELGVTRAAVWKQIEKLRALGFGIESSPKDGSRLVFVPDSVRPPVLRRGLDTKWAGCEITYFPQCDSTNRIARQMAQQGAPHGALVITDEQTAGRGRRGRSWVSPSGESVMMTVVLRPQEHPSRVALVSLSVALAVAEAIEEASGVGTRIKWPNDIVSGGRKVCGMLLEMDADEQCVHSIAAGIGINVHQQAFDGEIAGTASSLDLLSGRTLSRADVVRAFLRALERAEAQRAAGTLMEAYRARSATLGRRVRVIGVQESFEGEALEVTESGSLLVKDENGMVREVLAGDVSVRGLMGYA